MPTPPRPHALIDGRYRLEQPLGSGSMGFVHRAVDVFLERVIAIKFIDPANAKDESNIERFLKEARAIAQIRHDNVVQVYAFGPHAGSVYFAMEYVAGESLESVIDDAAARDSTVDLERALAIVRAVASGLQAVHDRKLVHRDVKPSNVVLENGTGRPVLVDFGLARRRTASNPKLSITAGTPMYMAPEQARDPDGTKVTFRADIYALACTTYELLTGQPVFDGKDVYDVLVAHQKSPPPRASSLRPELAPLDAALVKALAKEPAERYDSAAAFAADLDLGLARIVERRATAATASVRARVVGPEERVLVLAADASMRRRVGKAVERTLEAAGRAPAIEYAASVEEAWEALRRDAARVFVVDDAELNPPVAALVANLRRLPGGSTTTVLVLSPAWQELRASMTEAGVRDVLPKPLNVQMLASAIERIVARRSAPDA